MRKALLVLAAFAPLACAQVQSYSYTYSGVPIPVYPSDWNTWAVARIFMPRSVYITGVTVSVQVQFNGVGDLNVFLYSPAGTRTKLLERNCGSLVNIDTSFNDNAQTSYNSYCPSTAGQGPFRGNEPLGNSYGQNAYGYWRLGVENNGSSKSGYLTGFSITVTGTPLGTPTVFPNTIFSASSFQGGPIAPGDQVGIAGVNLGPTDGVRAPAGANLPTGLGGTTVTFDGVAAPIYYSSDKLVVVQSPISLTPGTPTSIVVTGASGASTPVSTQVVATKPGIWTYETLGRGQARATNPDGSLNGDGTVNGTDKPVAAGSNIQILATGLGAVNPPIQPGVVAPSTPPSPTAATVTATVGGLPATVVSSTAYPGQVGFYQVTITIPSKMKSGAVPVVIDVGGASSQEGVTIQVK